MQERIEQNALELLHAIREHHPDIYARAHGGVSYLLLAWFLQTSSENTRRIAGAT